MSVETIIAELEQLDRDRAALMERLKTAMAGKLATMPDAPSIAPGRFISPSQATAICGRSESQIRRDCESNPLDAGGFGLKMGGRWHVEEARYSEMRGNARFRR
jgi:hypothetical protein